MHLGNLGSNTQSTDHLQAIGRPPMTIFLYVKTHNITGLKYLGKTTSADPHMYTGSGTRWLNHLNKHGYDYSTDILKECSSDKELKIWGKYYSDRWDVANSAKWANLKSEEGQGGNHSELTKQKMSKSKKALFESGKLTPWNKNKVGIVSNETKAKISNANLGKHVSLETKQKMAEADRSKYTRVAPVSSKTKEKLAKALQGKPSRAAGYKWTDEQKKNLSNTRKGQKCPTKGMKRVYREDGTFYFRMPE